MALLDNRTYYDEFANWYERDRASGYHRMIDDLEKKGAVFEEQVVDMLGRGSHPVQLIRKGSLFWFSFGAEPPPRRAEQIPRTAAGIYSRLHGACLSRGVYLAPSAYEVGFLCSVHTSRILSDTVAILGEAFAETFKGESV